MEHPRTSCRAISVARTRRIILMEKELCWVNAGCVVYMTSLLREVPWTIFNLDRLVLEH